MGHWQSDPMAPPESEIVCYRFAGFTLDPRRRCLNRDGAEGDGATVALSSRGFDILLLLLVHRDRVVGKDEILQSVWHGTLVEENNLAVQISGLRRLLDESTTKLIATVPGRGYRFIGTVEEERAPDHAPAGFAEAGPATIVAPPAPIALAPMPPAPTMAVEHGPAARPRRRVVLALTLVLVAAGAFAASRLLWPPTDAPRLSIAVLPFRNLTGDAAKDYLADAIGDDLTTDLSHLPGSTVIARESADAYKDKPVRAQTIGRALRVRYLLEGSLVAEGATLHVNAQLIDARTGGHLWASAFDVAAAGLDGARRQIVQHLASVLDVALVQTESARSFDEHRDNPDAADLYLRARSLLDRDNSLAGLLAAQSLLERAVTAAPDFADAMAQLGLVLLNKISAYDDPDEFPDHERATDVINRAFALAPRNPLTITAHGRLAWLDDQCDQAVPSFELALSLDPDETSARDGLALCDLDLGRLPGMIDALQDVLRIDPAAPNSAVRQNMIGMGYLLLGKLPEALDWLERARAGMADPSATPSAMGWQEENWLSLMVALWQSGDHGKATALFAAYTRLCPRRTVWQIGSYDTKAMASLPGRAAFLRSLHDIGMPLYADETQDFGVTPANSAQSGDDFAATPLAVPGALRIDTPALKAMLDAAPATRVLDLGRGSAMIPGSVLVWPLGIWGDQDAMLDGAAAAQGGGPDQPVVIMQDGPLGWSSYNAALHLVARGYHHVLWYRGGEQSWVAAGHPVQDQRPQ